MHLLGDARTGAVQCENAVEEGDRLSASDTMHTIQLDLIMHSRQMHAFTSSTLLTHALLNSKTVSFVPVDRRHGIVRAGAGTRHSFGDGAAKHVTCEGKNSTSLSQ